MKMVWSPAIRSSITRQSMRARLPSTSAAPLSVMFVIDTLGASGTAQSTATIAAQLQAHGHRVAVVTLGEAGYGDEQRLRRGGLDTAPLAATRYVGRVREVRRRIRHTQPDVVHTALFQSDMVGRLAAFGTGVPVVSSWVGTRYDAPALPTPFHRQKMAVVRLAA